MRYFKTVLIHCDLLLFKKIDVMKMTIHDERFTDNLNSAFYEKTFAEREREIKELKRRIRLRDMKCILNLHLELDLQEDKIAALLDLEVEFVARMLQKDMN